MRNNTIRRWISALCCLVLLMSMIACTVVPDGGEESSVGTKPETETQTDTAVTTDTSANGTEVPPEDVPGDKGVTFLKSDLSKFKIVYARGSSDAVVAAAEELSSFIKTMYGVQPEVGNDLVVPGSSVYSESEYEILLGQANRTASNSFNAVLRQDDYGYTCYGTKIVISGWDDYTFQKAIDNFSTQVLMYKKSDDRLFCSEWAKLVVGTYDIDTFKLNGTDISNYRIVYPANGTLFEDELAAKLQLAIADTSGYVLSVVTDATKADGTPEILVGATARTVADRNMVAQTGYVVGTGVTVSLYGSTATGVGEAVKGFLSCMEGNVTNKTCTLNFTSRQAFALDRTTVSSMSFNVLTTPMTDERNDRVISTITRYLPDTFGVQEANPTWMKVLPSRLGEYYDYVGTGTQGGSKGNEHVAIFYNKERFKLIKGKTYWLTDTPEVNSVLPGSDWPRVYTYVILQDKVTGEKFMHLNTHFDTNESVQMKNAQLVMEFLKDYNDLPVLISGDLNSLPTSEQMQYLFSKGFIWAVDALGLTSYPPTFYYKPVTCDYVLATNDCLEILDYIVDNQRIHGDFASDHFAVTIKFRFRGVGKINHGW